MAEFIEGELIAWRYSGERHDIRMDGNLVLMIVNILYAQCQLAVLTTVGIRETWSGIRSEVAILEGDIFSISYKEIYQVGAHTIELSKIPHA